MKSNWKKIEQKGKEKRLCNFGNKTTNTQFTDQQTNSPIPNQPTNPTHHNQQTHTETVVSGLTSNTQNDQREIRSLGKGTYSGGRYYNCKIVIDNLEDNVPTLHPKPPPGQGQFCHVIQEKKD